MALPPTPRRGRAAMLAASAVLVLLLTTPVAGTSAAEASGSRAGQEATRLALHRLDAEGAAPPEPPRPRRHPPHALLSAPSAAESAAAGPGAEGPSSPHGQGEQSLVVDLGPGRTPEAKEAASRTDTAAWRRRREKVAALLWLEGRLRELREGLDEKAYAATVAADEEALASDSRLPGTARTLGKMREQMHDFAAPLFREVVDEQLGEVKERRQALVQELTADPPAPAAPRAAPAAAREEKEEAGPPPQRSGATRSRGPPAVLAAFAIGLAGAALAAVRA